MEETCSLVCRNSLARVSGLKVIARTSAFHFKGANIDIREVGQLSTSVEVFHEIVLQPTVSYAALPYKGVKGLARMARRRPWARGIAAFAMPLTPKM